MAETDVNGRFLEVNDRYCEITGRSREELLLLQMQDITHPDDIERNLPLFREGVENGGSFEIEKRYVRPDGSAVWVHNSVTAVREPDGDIASTVCVSIDISERRAAEEQLRRNKDTFYNLIQNNPFGVYLVDADFRLAEVSLGSRKVFENVRPLIGRDFAEVLRIVWTEPFATEAIARFRHTLDTGEAYSAPSTVERRGDIGAVEAYDWRVERVELPDGRPGVVCYFYDLSERQRLEAEVRDASERIELALDAGAVAGTWVWDIPQDRFTADDRFARSFGLDPDACRRGISLEIVKQSIHPEDLPAIEALLQKTMVDGGPYRGEYRVRQLDGQYQWVEAAGRCDLDADGRALRFPGVLVNIEARKRDEAALRESEARLRALTDNLPAGMVYQIATGRDGSERRFLYVSQSHEELTGVPAEAVLQDASVAYDLILEDDRQRLSDAEAVAMHHLKPFDEVARFRRADGEVRWCRIISAPREQPDGSLVWDGIQIDITDQKVAEQGLRELNATLEGRAAQRAAELAQAQDALRQSQKLESMGQLTGGVAHDFNNLLTPIIGGLDMLQRRRIGDERAQRTIAGALASAERAKTLVQRLLAFARRQPLQPKAVDIADLVLGVARLLESTLGPRITLQLELEEKLPPARADANQLEMALLNLALNARDAMPDGGSLTVGAATRLGGAGCPGMIEISVRDTGLGMDEQTLSRAVEPFFSTKGIGQGTGLGLSMVHGLAAQLGGELTIESSPGAGTAIKLLLPTTDSAPEAAGDRPDLNSHVGAGTALLVDDEELVRASTGDMLRDMGNEVIEADSAEAALQRMKDGLRPSLLVTDHLMPGMTGTELAKSVRELRGDMPIIIISGYAEMEGIQSDIPRLTKPFRHADLEASICALARD